MLCPPVGVALTFVLMGGPVPVTTGGFAPEVLLGSGILALKTKEAVTFETVESLALLLARGGWQSCGGPSHPRGHSSLFWKDNSQAAIQLSPPVRSQKVVDKLCGEHPRRPP